MNWIKIHPSEPLPIKDFIILFTDRSVSKVHIKDVLYAWCGFYKPGQPLISEGAHGYKKLSWEWFMKDKQEKPTHYMLIKDLPRLR